MRRKLLLILVFMCSFLLVGCNKQRNILEEAKKELPVIKSTVQEYYLALERGRYADALDYIEYIDDTKDYDKLWLSKSAGQYAIEFSEDNGDIIGYEYSPKSAQFRVITVVGLDNKIDGQDKQINEAIYIKKINGSYRILHISSEDMKINHRGSSISTEWNASYDGEKYISLQ